MQSFRERLREFAIPENHRLSRWHRGQAGRLRGVLLADGGAIGLGLGRLALPGGPRVGRAFSRPSVGVGGGRGRGLVLVVSLVSALAPAMKGTPPRPRGRAGPILRGTSCQTIFRRPGSSSRRHRAAARFLLVTIVGIAGVVGVWFPCWRWRKTFTHLCRHGTAGRAIILSKGAPNEAAAACPMT